MRTRPPNTNWQVQFLSGFRVLRTLNLNTEPTAEEHHVPFSRFFTAVILQLAIAVALFAVFAPNVFHAEVAQPWKILLWTALFGIPLSLFEYIYHRYLLHSAVLPFMSSMHRAHSTHHGLTSVKAPVTPHEPSRMVEVKSDFPVEEPHQEESMMFPLWSLPIFFAVFLPLFGLPVKFLFPQQPIILGLFAAVTLYYTSYEVWHAILHLPFEKFWEPMMANRVFGGVFKHMYSFHLMHHWRPTSNLAIVGCWGLAIWDHIFRTHRRPENMPLDGAEVNYHDAKLNKPLWPISMLDGWQASFYKGSRSIERFLARVFLGRTAG